MESLEEKLEVKAKIEALEAREINVIEELYAKHFQTNFTTKQDGGDSNLPTFPNENVKVNSS